MNFQMLFGGMHKRYRGLFMKRLVILVSVMLGITVFSSGCEKMGRMMAKAEKGIENGIQKMENAFEKMESDFEKGQKEGKKDD